MLNQKQIRSSIFFASTKGVFILMLLFGYSLRLLSQSETPSVVSFTNVGVHEAGTFYIDFELRFSESVSGVDRNDFTLERSSQLQGAEIASITGDDKTYTIRVKGLSDDLDGVLMLHFKDFENLIESSNGVSFQQSEEPLSSIKLIGAAFDISRLISNQEPDAKHAIYGNSSYRSISFDNTGNTLFLVNNKGDVIEQYILTEPYVLTGIDFLAEQKQDAFFVGDQETAPTDISFSPSGDKMFLLGNTNEVIYEYVLETAFDVTTAVYKGADHSLVLPKRLKKYAWFVFNRTGTKLFLGIRNETTLFEYELTLPFDISTARFLSDAGRIKNKSEDEFVKREVRFNPDGSRALFLQSNAKIISFDLNEPFDLSQADSLAENELFTVRLPKRASPGAFEFNDDGTKLFVLISSTTEKIIYEYLLDAKKLEVTELSLWHIEAGNQNNTLISDDKANNEELKIAFDKNDLALKFATSSLKIDDEIQYQSFLEGEDQEWSEWFETPELRYERLSAGSYSFNLRAKNIYGQLSQSRRLEFKILPPWYLSKIAIGSYVVGLILFIVLIVKLNQRKLVGRTKLLEQTVSERTQEISKKMIEVEAANVKINDQAKRLKELDQVKSRFFANISHELKTPLTLINAPISALLNKPSLDEKETRQSLEIAQKNGSRLRSLVEEILDLTKLEAGKLKLTENPVNLNEFLGELVAEYSLGFNQKKIQFHFRYELQSDFSIMLDAAKAGKILNNLLSNALKFTPENGEITFTVKHKADAQELLEIVVADSGEGIHPNDLPHIFNRFYQAEEGHKKAAGGTGIGLALAKELAGLFKGSLHATSEMGKGAVFTFYFPFEETDYVTDIVPVQSVGMSLEKSIQATIENYTTKFEIEKPVVLVTEDHPDMRAFISGHLAQYFEVLQAENGKVAYEILKSEKIDIVISDVMMPVMDGFELLEAIKKNASLNQVSVVMLTARGAAEDKLYALTLGIDDYLTKPFDPSEFLARIKNILDNRIKIIKELGAISDDESNEALEEFIKLHDISDHEYQILKFIAKRYSNKEIGDELGLSANTIKYHLKKLYFKLDISTRQEMYDRAEEVVG